MRTKLFSVLFVAVLLVSLFLATPVSARLRFCSADPIFSVGGHEVSVVIELAPYEVRNVISERHPVHTLLKVPRGEDAELVSLAGEFPERVSIVSGPRRTLSVTVVVPAVRMLEAVRVSMYVDGRLVARQTTRGPVARLAIPWWW